MKITHQIFICILLLFDLISLFSVCYPLLLVYFCIIVITFIKYTSTKALAVLLCVCAFITLLNS